MDYLLEVLKAAIWDEQPPEAPKWNKWLHRNLSDNHCEECLMLHECWFEKEKTPKWPHHAFCHCVLEDISYNEVLNKSNAYCPYSKFDPFLFDPDNFYKHGKSYMLESWGVLCQGFSIFKRYNRRTRAKKIYKWRLSIRFIR